VFVEEKDSLQWKLTNHGTYTVNSFYNFFAGFGKTRFIFAPMWKTRVPPSVKIFFYLLLNDRLLTQQISVRRRIINSASGCLMCAEADAAWARSQLSFWILKNNVSP
jgi:zinc-binding in reverse transcriptase